MRTIVLSGFRPFGNYLANTTEKVAKKLHDQCLSGFFVHTIVFPATIPTEDRGYRLLHFAKTVDASGIVCLGMSSDVAGLCVESKTRNLIYNSKYCCPEINGQPVDPRDPVGKEVELDHSAWNVGVFHQKCFTHQVPIVWHSLGAGGFCCNHLMWQLHKAQKDIPQIYGNIPFLFIHVPCCPEAVPDKSAFEATGKKIITVEEVVRGLEILLRFSSLGFGYSVGSSACA